MKIKLIYASILITILLLQVASFDESSNFFLPQAEAVKYSNYENPIYGYKIDYPSNWVIEESSDLTEITFTMPSTSEDIGADFVIISKDIGEEVMDVSLYQVNILFIELFKTAIPGFQVNQNYESVLDGNPARKIEFSASIEGNSSTGIMLFTLKDERMFALVLMSEPKDFSDDKKIGQKMFDSFEIVEPTILQSGFGLLTDYQSNLFEFSIDIPSNWHLDDTVFPYDSIPEVYDSYSSVLYASDGTEEYFYNSLEILYYKNHNWAMNYQDQDYLDRLVDAEKDYCKDATFDEIGYECSNHSIVNSEVIEINEKQAYQVKETWTEKYSDASTFDTHITIVHIVDGNNVWEIISNNMATDYPDNADTINEIIQSFQVDNENVLKSSDAIFEEEITPNIPDWIKNNAEWWVDGTIDDNAFVGGIEFLIKEDIIQIPETVQSTDVEGSGEIPAWIKNNADWWSQGLISNNDFIKGIQFMVENGIIRVSS